MAQLPSNITNWPEFDNAPNITTNHSWVDDFFDFSEAKRTTHRRSFSDPAIFVEEQPIPANNNDFNGFDDEQFMNKFTEDNVGPSFDPSNHSTSFDHNSGDRDKESLRDKHNKEEQMQQRHQEQIIKKESEELESQSNTGEAAGAPTNPSAGSLEPKRVKRILANRQSAQRSRVRKLQYVSELERSVTTLQAEVLMLSPKVAFLDQRRLLLNVANSALKQKIAALAQDRIFKDAAHEALTKEIERLRELQQKQNVHNMESPAPQQSDAQQLLYI